MINCSLSCVIAAALLGSMLYMLFSCNKNDKILYFMSLLNPKQQEIYKNITRKIKYLSFKVGSWFNFGIGLPQLLRNHKSTNLLYICSNCIRCYLCSLYINAKSTYMLDHIDNGEQAKAWLAYREMKLRCHLWHDYRSYRSSLYL